jgi:hypothetical protein
VSWVVMHLKETFLQRFVVYQVASLNKPVATQAQCKNNVITTYSGP